MDLIGQTLLNRYQISANLGRGRSGEVYRARDERRQYEVAIKVFHEALAEDTVFLQRFQDEAKSLAGFSHANIARFYSFEFAAPLAFIVTDYIPGITLRRRIILANGAPMPIHETASIIQQVCAGLHYAHSEGLIHGDLKPGNIMVQPDGRVSITDFGIQRLIESISATATPGIPAYFSPEQCLGKPVEAPGEIYSLGIILYEMLTGQRPFTGETAPITGTNYEKVRWEQIHAEPVPPREYNPEMSAALQNCLLKCIEKQPEARFGSIFEFIQAFNEAVGSVEPEKSYVQLDNNAPAIIMKQPLPTLASYEKDSDTNPQSSYDDPYPGMQPTPAIKSSTPPAKKKSSSNLLKVGLALLVLAIAACAFIGGVYYFLFVAGGPAEETAVSVVNTQQPTQTAIIPTATKNVGGASQSILVATPVSESPTITAPVEISASPEPAQDSIFITEWEMEGWRIVSDCHEGLSCWKSFSSKNLLATLTSAGPIHIVDSWIDPVLFFNHRYRTNKDTFFGKSNSFDKFSVRVSVVGSGTWQVIKEYAGDVQWTTDYVDLTRYIGKDIYIQFMYDADDLAFDTDGWSVYDVMVLPSPPAP